MKFTTRLVLAFIFASLGPRMVAQSYTFTTLAGSPGNTGSADGTGSAARFSYPRGVAVDSNGNVFVADFLNQTIRKITAGGVVTTLAGTAGSSGSADGTGSAARFSGPTGVAVDGSGNVFVTDYYNSTIRKITPGGVVTTLAGTPGSFGSADGTGSAARFSNRGPDGVAVDGSGNVFVTDAANHTIRKITAGGVVSTLAGSAGSSGSADGTGSAARFNGPRGLAVDGNGNVFVADAINYTVRKITAGGVVTTLAGTAGSNGTADGTGGAARFDRPVGVAVDSSGNVFVANQNDCTMRKITAGGVVTTIAGTAGSFGSTDGTGSAARFYNPDSVAVDGSGNLYVGDHQNHTIRKGVPAATAPSITTHPTSQSVTVGATTTLTVAATGTAPLTYQWRKGGVNLINGGNTSGVTTATLTLTNAQTTDAGSYDVVVSNSAGSATSTAATLAVATPPTITTQPVSQGVAAGSSATLTVVASGTAPLTYQWRKDGTAIAGATNASLTTGGAGSYTVVVTNSVGSVTSDAAILTVAPAINVQPTPASQTVNVGSTVTYSVTATGTAPLTYQWRKGGTVLGGATNASLTLSNVQASNAGSYDVVVSNSAGSATSTAATLAATTPPVITIPPTSQGVVAGASATFTVVASGTAPLSYQWRRGGVNLANGITISGATTVTLTLTNVQVADAGSYDVVVANSASSVTSAAATLTVAPAITIAPSPANQTVNAGSNVTYSVTATGTAPLSYQWRKGGVNLTNGGNISGATATTLILTSVQTAEAGSYDVVVSNTAGSATSPALTLVVVVLPAITVQPVPANQTVNAGSSVIYSVTVTGTAPLSYQWRKDGRAISGATNATYALGNVQPTDGGTYSVVVTNSAGAATSTAATLTVISPPEITTSPASQGVMPGSPAIFTVAASGTAPLTYQWRKDGAALGGATNASVTLGGVQFSDAGSYTVVVANSAGGVTSSAATLTVGPAMSTQPQAQSVLAGSSVTFAVVASGTTPLSYQWRKDGSAISGATTASLALINVETASAGNYVVVVSNAIGSVTSTAAALTVNSVPAITTPPAAQSVLVGGSVTFSVSASGTTPLTYQWRKDGAVLSGATTSSLVLTNVQTSNEGAYSVVVSNSVGSVTSNTAALAVTAVVGPPVISSPPGNQAVTVGGTATFAVAVTGTAPFTYRWQKDGVPLSGSSGANLILNNVQASDAGDYAVAVSNSAGTATSSAARLTVNSPPTITAQPLAQSVTSGGSVTLTVGAGGTPPLTYQWRKDGAAISGATTSNFTLTDVQAASSGSFLVVVTNAFGAATSNVAIITVNIPPAITAQPADVIAAIGTVTAFSVTATGTAPLAYQWRKGGAAIPSATGATLSFAGVQLADAATYTVLVSNPAGSVLSAEAKLIVAAAPEIIAQPASISVTVGSQATFSVTAIGAAPLAYQWQRDGNPIAGTGSTLVLSNVQAGDSAGYRVVVTNAAGSVTSAIATLGVTGAPVPPTIVVQPENQSRGVGSNVTFRVGVSGTSPFVFQWRKNGASLAGATSDTLILPNVSLADAANYTVLVSNSQGSVTSGVATLAIIAPPTIITPPFNQSVARGATISLAVVANGTPPLTYQWFKDGNPIAGATNTILPRDTVTDADAGSYWVTVSNGAGPVTSPVAALVVSGAVSRLSNLSVRTAAGAGNQTLIVGFVIAGTGVNKPVLIRAIGPSLAAFGVTGALADPQLALFRGAIQVATNDNWGDSLSSEQVGEAGRRLGAFSLDPRSRDAALYSGLQSESYTAQVVSAGVSGIALLELYDGDTNLPLKLVNVSARSQVGTGANILIAGFVVQGNAPKTLVLRAVGPTLAAFGVSDALVDPQLVVLRGSDIVATNDDWWRGNGAQTLPPVFASVGAFALATQSRDAALVVSLPPGQYTAQISGADGGTGVALVEVYEMP